MNSQSRKKEQKVKTKQKNTKGPEDFMNLSFAKLTALLSRFETEVELRVKDLVHQGEKTSREVRKGIQDLLKRLRNTGFYARAQERAADFEHEMVRLTEDLLSKIAKLEVVRYDFMPLLIVKESREALKNVFSVLKKSHFISKIKAGARKTQKEFFAVLNLPSSAELHQLERRLGALEGRLQRASAKRAV